MKNKNGQIIFMFVFSVLAVFAFITLIINVSKLSVAKIKLQKAADSIALTMATYQARCFNAISDKNFILKFPSGKKTETFKKDDPDSFSFPGIDQISMYDGYEFISESEFQNYLKIITPHQNQQDKFVSIYQQMIPRLKDDLIAKNDKDAKVLESQMSQFNFRRENVRIKYRDWIHSSGSRAEIRVNVDAWMVHPNSYVYSMVTLNKIVTLWNKTFNLQAIALGEVVNVGAELWPDPKPHYKAKLGQTREKGVLH